MIGTRLQIEPFLQRRRQVTQTTVAVYWNEGLTSWSDVNRRVLANFRLTVGACCDTAMGTAGTSGTGLWTGVEGNAGADSAAGISLNIFFRPVGTGTCAVSCNHHKTSHYQRLDVQLEGAYRYRRSRSRPSQPRSVTVGFYRVSIIPSTPTPPLDPRRGRWLPFLRCLLWGLRL